MKKKVFCKRCFYRFENYCARSAEPRIVRDTVTKRLTIDLGGGVLLPCAVVNTGLDCKDYKSNWYFMLKLWFKGLFQ